MVQEILKIAAFQFNLEWENPDANRAQADRMLSQLPGDIDIVFLPEMFTTGFTMNAAKVAEPMTGETLEWLKYRSADSQIVICGSLVIQENEDYFNRLVFVEPSGKVHQYNKRHLFTMAGEDRCYSLGESRLIVEYKGWRICPLICYDLRFPVWSRNRNEYDILTYSANWPESRIDVWKTLLKARAIENQSYVVGVNRVGVDRNNISYSGDSQVIGPKGNILSSAKGHSESIVCAEFNYNELLNFRKKFPVLNDADHFTLG